MKHDKEALLKFNPRNQTPGLRKILFSLKEVREMKMEDLKRKKHSPSLTTCLNIKYAIKLRTSTATQEM